MGSTSLGEALPSRRRARGGLARLALATRSFDLDTRFAELDSTAARVVASRRHNSAAVAELADAQDSGSCVQKTCRFDSCRPHPCPGLPRAFLLSCLPLRVEPPDLVDAREEDNAG